MYRIIHESGQFLIPKILNYSAVILLLSTEQAVDVSLINWNLSVLVRSTKIGPSRCTNELPISQLDLHSPPRSAMAASLKRRRKISFLSIDQSAGKLHTQQAAVSNRLLTLSNENRKYVKYSLSTENLLRFIVTNR
jgi:hypothetical protein